MMNAKGPRLISNDWRGIKNKVISYYESTFIDYKLMWYTSHDLSLHFGFADKPGMSHSEIINNENRFLAHAVKLRKADYVLDAGCGVGGSSIWIAKNYGARVVGITISKSQVDESIKNAKLNNVEKLTKFYEMDFHDVSFKDNTFDVVWAIVSFCQSWNRDRLLKEMFRILKPGGRLIVSDAFRKNSPIHSKEGDYFEKCLKGFAIYNLFSWDQFGRELSGHGFGNIISWDKTKEIMPSCKRMYWTAIATYPFWITARLLRLIPKARYDNAMSCLAQWNTLKKGYWVYGVYYAEKPRGKNK